MWQGVSVTASLCPLLAVNSTLSSKAMPPALPTQYLSPLTRQTKSHDSLPPVSMRQEVTPAITIDEEYGYL